MPAAEAARRVAPVLVLAVAWSVVLAAGSSPAVAQGSVTDADAAFERLFVARVGQAGVALRVTSARGGDAWSGTSDDGGIVYFPLEVTATDELRFASADAAWRLDWVARVENAHLSPEIPLEIDVSAFLERASGTGSADAAPPASTKASTKASTQPSGPTSGNGESTRPAQAEPGCRDELSCGLAMLRKLSAARSAGDCGAALDLASELRRTMPAVADRDPVLGELAELHLDCALDADASARRELLLRRAVEIATGPQGDGWCRPERSRTLADAHLALGEPEAAAAGARQARTRCPGEGAPFEWELYLRLRLGQLDRAAEVAAASEADRDLGAFLGAWTEHAAGRCPEPLARWLPAEDAPGPVPTPCSALPRWICERAQTVWLTECGAPEQLDRLAAALRASLPAPPSPEWSEGLSAEQVERMDDLAEIETLRGRYDAAAADFARLAELPASDARRGRRACRLGSVLLRAGRDVEALDAFRRAAELAPAEVPGGFSARQLDRAVVANNVAVLADRVGAARRDDLGALEKAIEALTSIEGSADTDPWRLTFENNLLALRTRAAATDEDPQRGLDGLRRLDDEVRGHLEAVRSAPGSGDGGGSSQAACSIPAFVDRTSGDRSVESSASVDSGV